MGSLRDYDPAEAGNLLLTSTRQVEVRSELEAELREKEELQ